MDCSFRCTRFANLFDSSTLAVSHYKVFKNINIIFYRKRVHIFIFMFIRFSSTSYDQIKELRKFNIFHFLVCRIITWYSVTYLYSYTKIGEAFCRINFLSSTFLRSCNLYFLQCGTKGTLRLQPAHSANI